MFKTYGYFAVATYLSVYLATLFTLFACVRAGLIVGPDVNAFLNANSIKQYFMKEPLEISPAYVDFGMAWLLTKTTEPFRLVATIALLPVLLRRAPLPLLKLFRIERPAAVTSAVDAVASKPPQAPLR